MHCLIIGKVWPEPRSTAAGRRTLDVILALQSAGWQVSFACAAQRGEHALDLTDYAVETHTVAVNDAGFDRWVEALAPDVVIFDRFMTEEQFGWRVAAHCPEALRVVDTSDLHCLRIAREAALKQDVPLDLYNALALREIAAIYRSDLSLMISEYEITLLKEQFHVSDALIAYWPFAMGETRAELPSLDQRKHFILLGSFLHGPNLDAARWCRAEIWPKIRAELPEAELHCYGSYGDKYAGELHAPKLGFYFKGRAEDALETMQQYRVNLAPLRYGAGLKGKIFDGFAVGTPTVLTPIAAEGITEASEWGLPISDGAEAFARAAVQLYRDEATWEAVQANGQRICRERFALDDWQPKLVQILEAACEQCSVRRQQNFIGQMLRHHHHRSTEFMSRWIEAKNR